MPFRKAGALADSLLDSLGMGSIADGRVNKLTPEEHFCVMLLRAVMVENAVLLLDRPFSILTNAMEDKFIMDSLETVDGMFTEAYIYDCIWMKLRYRRLDGPEN